MEDDINTIKKHALFSFDKPAYASYGGLIGIIISLFRPKYPYLKLTNGLRLPMYARTFILPYWQSRNRQTLYSINRINGMNMTQAALEAGYSPSSANIASVRI